MLFRSVSEGSIPPPRAWPQRNPEAAARWDRVRPAVVAKAEELAIGAEVLVAPDAIRQLCWAGFLVGMAASDVERLLADQGCRPWQIEQLSAALTGALAD